MSWRTRCLTAASACLIALFALAPAYAAYEDEIDPPVRVARLSVASGDVSFQPGGEEEWVHAELNRPLVRGDRLWADRDSRAELQVGSTSVRLGETTSFQILELDDRIAQFELTEGVMNLRVRRFERGQVYEVATPTLAFTVTEPGSYRIEVDSRGRSTQVIVWNGGGEATGEGSNFPLREGDAVRFYDTALRDYEQLDRPRYDDFDRFALERDERLERSESLRYVPDEVIGYDDLDEYGSWDTVPDYGAVWYPRRVASDWAPYRNGHWIWQDPWGWTWVDDAPWGFAPFHYGRWAYTGNRWGWIPGQRNVRPVYAPALVTFVGGSGWSVGISGGGISIGWFPLGYREVYIPPYRASRNYFTQVNVSNTVINNNYITNVYNNNYVGGQALTGVNYVNRRARGGFTAVSGNNFTAAKPVQQSIVQVNAEAMNRAPVTQVAAVAPTARSVMGMGAAANAKPRREVVDRRVVARTAPPPTPVPFSARQQQLQRTPGRPLPPPTAQSLQRDRGAQGQQGRQRENVQVVTERGTNTRTEGPRRGNRPEGAGRGNERQTGREQPQGQGQPQPQGQPQGQAKPAQQSQSQPQGQAPQQERQGDTRARQQQDLQRQQQEREVRAQQQREEQGRTAREEQQRQDKEARGQQQRQQQEREAREQQQRQEQEARGQQQRQQQERDAREQQQRQEQEARGQQQRQQQEREAREQQQRQDKEARGQQQRQQQEREAREQQQRQEQEARGQQQRQQQEREAREQQQRQDKEARGQQQRQQQEQQRQAEQQQRQAEQQQRQRQEQEARGQQQRQQQEQQRQAEQQQRQAEQQRQREQQQQQQRQPPPQQQAPPPQQQQQQPPPGKKPSKGKDKDKDKDGEEDDKG